MIKIKFPEELAENIKAGEIGVIPTDTMYGVVASALNPKAVERLREVREKPDNKPLVILISKIEDLKIFNIELDEETMSILNKIWPAPVTIVLPCHDERFEYLTRGTNTLGVRFPDDVELLKLISTSGPLVAPSANPAGKKPAENLDEAWEYFSELDFYFDDGVYPTNPSTLIRIENGKAVVLRQGLWQVPDFLK